MDATLVRATLVPAFMKLAGEANWWAPRWMKHLYERFGFSEHEPPDEAPDESVELPPRDLDRFEDASGSRMPVGVGD
ncbi:MAG TPA: hypothetical protein VJM33_09545, partial [Microthrixaceae bacterium]|nr:hypothetical protein [Microthrixaceae bacterium]